MTKNRLRLGVNIDHVATVRNARGGAWPDPVRAAHLAVKAGADGITAHLREDRRHIRDTDMQRLAAELAVPLNFEMAATAEMIALAERFKPHAACLVPEKREERTTEGGLDVVGAGNFLERCIGELKAAGIRVSLFIEPDRAPIEASARLGADIVELHTGTYCEHALANDWQRVEQEAQRMVAAARAAHAAGLEVHAGHGLTYNTVGEIAAIPEIAELNIGHFLIGEAIMIGLRPAIERMSALMREARATAKSGGSRRP
jgi:pyridoxine 5-phosphate synthase